MRTLMLLPLAACVTSVTALPDSTLDTTDYTGTWSCTDWGLGADDVTAYTLSRQGGAWSVHTEDGDATVTVHRVGRNTILQMPSDDGTAFVYVVADVRGDRARLYTPSIDALEDVAPRYPELEVTEDGAIVALDAPALAEALGHRRWFGVPLSQFSECTRVPTAR